MKAKLKVGMISFAHMHAASYLQALLARKDVELVGIADENRERVRPFLSVTVWPITKMPASCSPRTSMRSSSARRTCATRR